MESSSQCCRIEPSMQNPSRRRSRNFFVAVCSEIPLQLGTQVRLGFLGSLTLTLDLLFKRGVN